MFTKSAGRKHCPAGLWTMCIILFVCGSADLPVDATGISVSQFAELSDEDRKEVLLRNLTDRLKSLENLHVLVRTSRYYAPIESGGIGAKVKDIDVNIQELWQDTGSYRLDQLHSRQGVQTNEPYDVKAAYDAESGVSRMLGANKSSRPSRFEAKITYDHDSYNNQFRMSRFLGGFSGERIPSYLVTLIGLHQDISFEEFDHDNQSIVVQVWTDARVRSSPRQLLRCSIRLDKGWMFQEVMDYVDFADQNGRKLFRHIDATTLEASEIDGVWLPILTRLVASTHADDLATVYDISVEEAQVGTVESSDLLLEFPEGTLVNDRIEQVVYTVEGDTKKEEKSYAAIASVEPGDVAPTKTRNWRPVVIFVNVAIILGLLGLWGFRRRRLAQR